jgi:hypothetical protein
MLLSEHFNGPPVYLEAYRQLDESHKPKVYLKVTSLSTVASFPGRLERAWHNLFTYVRDIP